MRTARLCKMRLRFADVPFVGYACRFLTLQHETIPSSYATRSPPNATKLRLGVKHELCACHRLLRCSAKGPPTTTDNKGPGP